MSIVDELLKIDLGEVEIPKATKKLYLKKLKKEFIFECKALDPEKQNQIQMKAIKIDAKGVSEIDSFKLQALTVIEGCSEVFKSKELQSHFNVPIALELVRKLLLGGELEELFNTINDLSSAKVTDEEIKN